MKVYIGIDAHSTNYTLSSYNSEADDCTNAVTLKPEYEGIVKYAEKIKMRSFRYFFLESESP